MSPQNPAPRTIQDSPIDVWFQLRSVAPVKLIVIERIGNRRRHINKYTAIHWPRFRQQHPGIEVGGQPVSDDAGGRPGANDDAVVVVIGH